MALVRHLDPARVRSIVAAIKDAPDLDVPLCTEASKLGFETRVFQAQGRLNFSAVKQIRKYIRENNIHILHTHFYKTDLIGLMAVRGTPCRIITTPHGWSTKADLKLRCYEQLDRMLFPCMDAVVPLSHKLYHELSSGKGRLVYSLTGKLGFRKLELGELENWKIRKFGSKKINKRIPNPKSRLTNQRITNNEPPNNETKNIHLIPNGVDLSEIETVQKVAPELQNWCTSQDFVLGYIGQLIPRKGLDILLQALAQLDKTLQCKAVIIGDGPQLPELQKLAHRLGVQDQVRFFGFKDNRLEFLKGFDCFVLPSRLEGIPRCLMEAMAAGVPVIASDIPGCNDLIENRVNGRLFEPENAQDLKGCLSRAALHPEESREQAVQAREFVQQNYSADRMAREYEELYGVLVGG